MDEQVTELDFGLLWPNFKSLWDALAGNAPWSTNALSASVVIVLITLFVLFGLRVMYGAFLAAKRLRFLSTLIKDVNEDNLAAKRNDLAARARQNEDVGGLWLEFDESLVSSADKRRLWNTIDAEYFFNTSTLAAGITESRLIAAVPGFLTALGVIGTFAGLQLGLSGLDLNQGSLDQTSGQIQRIIDSAAVAFLTSVWGIGTSVLFNLFEKAIEQSLRKRIARLQSTIDRLFPRILSEQQLSSIEDHGRESREVLQGLAEKIGNKMQEAVLDMSERLQQGISSSISEVLTPAVERLVAASADLSNRQANSSEEVLSSLVGNFVEQIGAQAEQQRELMTSASSEMKLATGQLTSTLEQFMEGIQEQIGSMQRNQAEILESVSGSINTHIQETGRLVTQGDALTSRIGEMGDNLATVGETLRDSSESMKKGAALLDRTTRQIESALDHFATTLSESTKSTQAYVNETQSLTKLINDSLLFLDEFDGKTRKTSESLGTIATTVDSGLQRLQDNQQKFLTGMQGNLEAIQRQVADLLKNYGDTVQAQTVERLDTWNQQTREFSQQMVNAVSSMHETLSEVEDMIAQVRRK